MTIARRRCLIIALLGLSACADYAHVIDDGETAGSGRIVFRTRELHASTLSAALISVNPDGGGWTTLMSTVPSGPASALSPDGTRLAIGSPGAGINWFHIDSTALHAVATNRVVGVLAWGSDSRELFFDDYLTAKIGHVNTDGSGVEVVLNGLYPSSSGGLVTYSAGNRTWLSGIHGESARPIDTDTLSGISEGGPPRLSPDGRHIAMSRSVFNDSVHVSGQLFIYDIDTRQFRQLTIQPAIGGGAIGAPTWSPDGRRVAYGSGGRLFVVDADGAGVHAITPTGLTVSKAPAWSPHGTRLAFIANDDVYVVNVDGSGLQNLTNSTSIEFGVHWAPR